MKKIKAKTGLVRNMCVCTRINSSLPEINSEDEWHTNLELFCFCFRFDEREMVSGVNNPKSSVQRGIRQSILDNYPAIITYLDSIIPKKGDLKIVKWYENIIQRFRGIYKVISKNWHVFFGDFTQERQKILWIKNTVKPV